MEYNILIDYGLIFLGFIITLAAQAYINSSYNKYKKVKCKKNLSGLEVAQKILKANNLDNIYVVETKGNLTDHYDPTKKVVRLSSDIYHSETIAAISVAAHECGHAIQDKENYAFLKIRSKIVPFVNLCSKLGYLAIIIGIIFSLIDLAIVGVVLLLSMLLFQLITLPVEFDASRRALHELEKLELVDTNEKTKCSNMLTAAALTYVASLVTTLLQILRYVLMFRDRD